jgi:thioredoxin reductase (NADPH)
MSDHDLIIVGAGVAGLTAAMVAGRHGLNVGVIASSSPGGQIVNADRIENLPGFPQPIAGHELGTLLFEQAEAAGAQFMLDTVEGLRAECDTWIVRSTTQELSAGAVIIAAGSTLRKLGIPGEEEFLGKGVSYCASCDAPLFKGRDVCVIGGGDAAFDEALTLVEHAAHVTILHRGERPRALQQLRARAATIGNLAVEGDTVVERVVGGETVTGLQLRNVKTGTAREQNIDGAFIAIGLDPATAFLQGVVKLDPSGHIETDVMMCTSLAGVFAAGDIRMHSVSQLAAVAGDGATAAISAFRYLKARG